MLDADQIREAVTVATILTACWLAWLTVRVPNVLSQGWFWGAIAGLLLAVVCLTVGRP
jgi:hypothetical protein